jgi:hypothetical protein
MDKKMVDYTRPHDLWQFWTPILSSAVQYAFESCQKRANTVALVRWTLLAFRKFLIGGIEKRNGFTTNSSWGLDLSQALNDNFEVISWISIWLQRGQHQCYPKEEAKIDIWRQDIHTARCRIFPLHVYNPWGKNSGS